MKLSIRLLFMLSVLAFVFVGCAKSSDIENLQEQLDTMKSEQVGAAESIESQIESIRRSIASFENTDSALQKYINALQEQIISLKNSEGECGEEIEVLQNAVEALQKKDEDLQEQINALKYYVDGLISDTKEWANATFTTIEQYNSVSEIIADIQSQIDAINAKIVANEGTLAACEAVVASINESIASMKLDIENLQKKMTAILSQIQSIRYVPQYSDGNVVILFTADDGIITGQSVTLDFELKPASAAAEIATVWSADSSILSMNAVYTITKTPSVEELAIESVTAEDGYLTVTVSGKALKEEFFKSKCSASVRLGVTDGNNDITSKYIKIVPWCEDFIQFEDSDFKRYCIDNFDANGDGGITEAEAQAVTRIECANCNIYSLSEIKHFRNLEYIDVSCNRLATLDLSQNLNLQKVKLNDNKLRTIALTGLSALESLDCRSNKLQTITLTDLANLKSLDCSCNKLDGIDVNNNMKLDTLDCAGNKIASLNVDNNVDLVYLDCSENELSLLCAAKSKALKNLNCSSNTGITSLDLGNNTMLETLDASKTSLSALDVSSNNSLNVLKYPECAINATGLKVGTYVEVADNPGVVFYSSGSIIKIVSAKEAYLSWGYRGTIIGAVSDTDGAANTDKIIDESPAAQWCGAMGAAWYLPAVNELSTIYDNKSTLNTTLLTIGGTEFGTDCYVSSTECNSDDACGISFYGGDVYYGYKTNSDYVRAVRAL